MQGFKLNDVTKRAFRPLLHGPLARYVKLWVAHAPGMPGTFSPLPRVNDPDMHHGTCVTHVPWFIPGSLTSGFLWSQRLGENVPGNPQYYISVKRPLVVSISGLPYFITFQRVSLTSPSHRNVAYVTVLRTVPWRRWRVVWQNAGLRSAVRL